MRNTPRHIECFKRGYRRNNNHFCVIDFHFPHLKVSVAKKIFCINILLVEFSFEEHCLYPIILDHLNVIQEIKGPWFKSAISDLCVFMGEKRDATEIFLVIYC